MILLQRLNALAVDGKSPEKAFESGCAKDTKAWHLYLNTSIYRSRAAYLG